MLAPRKTMLGAAASAASAPPAADTMLARARAGSPRGELVQLPIPGLGPTWIELPGEMVVDEIEGAVHAAMAALNLPLVPLNAFTYGSRRLALTLAWAVRSATDTQERAGTPEQWMAMDIDLLQACSLTYADVRERLSPLSQPLSAEDFEAIRLVHEKKNPILLRSFGAVMLSNYLATTVAPPASSPMTQSSTGESP